LLNQPFLKLLEKAALSSFKFGLKNLVAQAYSGIFNLRYYQGVADQLGGRDAFFSSLSKMTNLEPDQLATDTNLFSSDNSMMEG
jgi:hypothetical protein